MTSLTEYIERAKPGQKSIYYIAADSLGAAASAPFVEQLIKKDLEVGKRRSGTSGFCNFRPVALQNCSSLQAMLANEGGLHTLMQLPAIGR